jgi:hypothetical protein
LVFRRPQRAFDDRTGGTGQFEQGLHGRGQAPEFLKEAPQLGFHHLLFAFGRFDRPLGGGQLAGQGLLQIAQQGLLSLKQGHQGGFWLWFAQRSREALKQGPQWWGQGSGLLFKDLGRWKR